MDINAFYDQDPRRRGSEEIDFGTEWTDPHARYELSWVVDTGELYATFEVLAGKSLLVDAVGALIAAWQQSAGGDRLEVLILAVIPTRVAVEQCLNGWQDVMMRKDSFTWVQERLADLPAPLNRKQ